MKIVSSILSAVFVSTTLFSQNWSQVGNGNNLTGPTANVWMLYSNPFQNELFIGGCFDSVNNTASHHAAYWNSSGFSSLQSGMDQGGSYVVTCAQNFNGDIYYGGRFNHANGIPSRNLAVWDGTSWDSAGSGANNNVMDFLVLNNELYVSGAFDTICGVYAKYIAKWDGVQWSQVGTSLPNYVVGMEIYNGRLYARTSVSCYVLIDDVWNDLQVKSTAAGIGYSVSNRGMAVYNNELYIGSVDSAGGTDVNGIARWNGLQWNSVGQGITGATTSSSIGIPAMIVYAGELYVGGKFTTAGNIPVNNIAKWNGTTWSALAGGVNNSVIALDTIDGKLAVGGLFSQADGIPVDRIAFWQWTTGIAPTDNESLTINFKQYESMILVEGTVPDGSVLLVMNSLGQMVGTFELHEGAGSQPNQFEATNGIYTCVVYSRNAMITSRKIVIAR